MNNLLYPNILRFIGLFAVQSLVLKQAAVSMGSYFHVFLYPLFLFFLPIQLTTAYGVLLGAGMGILVDLLGDTPGLHASAGGFSGYLRYFILVSFAPKGGFSGKELVYSPATMGWQAFGQAVGIFYFLHLFWYYSVDAFTFVYLGSILLKTIIAWFLSMVFVLLYTLMFNPAR
jgi:hypothetical protein